MVILVFCAAHVAAQTPVLERIGAAEGLSQGMIYDLLQDQQGFLWFATKDGVNRYDGYSFQVYQNNPFNPFSLADNEVQCLFEDRQGRIWVGTLNNGLNVLEPKTGRFYHLDKRVGPNIQQITQTADGKVWVGSNIGVYQVTIPEVLPADNPNLESIATVKPLAGLNPTTHSVAPRSFVVDLKGAHDNKLWVSTINEIGYIDPSTQKFQTIWTCPADFPLDFRVSYFQEAPDGSMWVGQPGQMLRICNGTLSVFKLPETSLFPYPNLEFDPSGNLFVGTRKQIFRLNAGSQEHPESARFELIHRFPPDGIIGSTKLLIDRSGLLWIGTNGYGLRKYNPGNPSFHHYLAGKSPRRIVPDRMGRIWIWYAGGIFRRLPEAGQPDQPALFSDPRIIQHDCVSTADGDIWILGETKPGTPEKGVLVRLDGKNLSEKGRFQVPVHISMFSRVYDDARGNLWILGDQSILTRFDLRSSLFSTFDFSGTTGFQELALSINRDVDGHLWIGTPHGLVEAIPEAEKMTFRLFKNHPEDPKSMNCNSVLASLDDPSEPDHYLWLGTKGGGLNRLDKTNGTIEHYTDAAGLPNNVVYAVLPEADTALWLSTNCGLSKFNPKTGVFQNFFSVDGLQDNEFNTLSYAGAPDGRLYFGGVNGITAFYPAQLKASFVAPPVLITKLRINNLPLRTGDGILKENIEQTSEITLQYFQNQLTFEFAAMDFSAPGMNQFRWKLTGADDDWVESSVANSATYAHLEPGHYTFEVISGGSRGIWTGKAVALTIHILPPWWRTGWAYTAYSILLGLSIFFIYRFQLKKIRLENKLAFEHREAQRLADLDRLKTNFFSSVTHEFRTPLTLLLEPARQLLSQTQDKAQQYRLELIERNARRLLHFVNQLLDLSKLEAGQMPLDLRPGNPANTMQAVAEQFRPAARQRHIRLELELPTTTTKVLMDEIKWEQVLSNLVSNAMKFTANGGGIILKLSAEKEELKSVMLFKLEVSDTGTGISPENLPKVFNRFYQAPPTVPAVQEREAVSGTGIGLSLCKELVERMGGTIAVESPGKLGAGTTFSVRMACEISRAPQPDSLADIPPGSIQPTDLPALKTATPVPLSGQEFMPNPDAAPLLLLIEDDTELRQFLRASLPSRFRIAEAVNGAEGIEMALELVPDLIISDLVMPRKNGYEVAETLKNNSGTSHIPFILLTAKSAAEAKMEGLNRGADVYLTKPFRADELVAHIDNLLVSRKRLQEHFSKSTQNKSVAESVVATLPPEENEFLQRLIQVVESNLDNEGMDADAFARSVFISRSQLHRKINALTGLSLTEFVRNYRLDRAKEMLSHRQGSISEIVWQTGFPNAKYFSTCFKERFGITPSGFAGSN